jgi:hypothetical protein
MLSELLGVAGHRLWPDFGQRSNRRRGPVGLGCDDLADRREVRCPLPAVGSIHEVTSTIPVVCITAAACTWVARSDSHACRATRPPPSGRATRTSSWRTSSRRTPRGSLGLRLQARSGRSVPGGVAADCVSARLERRAHEWVTPEGSRSPLTQASLSSIRLPHANSRACSRRNSLADRGVIPRSRSGASSQVASTVS